MKNRSLETIRLLPDEKIKTHPNIPLTEDTWNLVLSYLGNDKLNFEELNSIKSKSYVSYLMDDVKAPWNEIFLPAMRCCLVSREDNEVDRSACENVLATICIHILALAPCCICGSISCVCSLTAPAKAYVKMKKDKEILRFFIPGSPSIQTMDMGYEEVNVRSTARLQYIPRM